MRDIKLLIVGVLTLGATPAASQEICITSKDVAAYVKKHRLVKARCYWNAETAESEEEFQCVKTWVSPEKTYFSIEERIGCFVKPKTHTQSEMKQLYKVKEPIPPCDTCG